MDLDRFLEGRPELKKIMEQEGQSTLTQYVESSYRTVQSIDFSYFDKRFQEFSQTYARLLTPILGECIMKDSLETLEVNRLVSTADHQGIITHPFFLSTTYARSLYAMEHNQKSVVTFPCAGISLSNSSFPRGLAYHDDHEVLQKIYFKSLALKTPLCGLEPVEEDVRQKIIDGLFIAPLEKTKRQKLVSFMKDKLLTQEFFKLNDYDSQCTFGSHKLWKEIQPFKGIDLIYLSQEKLTSALLCDHHMKKGTPIYELLFTEKGQRLFLEHFNGIQGAFNQEASIGTELFWGIHDGKRVALKISNGSLVHNQSGFSISLDPQSIVEVINSKKIYPSMALCFIVLSFYYGFVCGGGFSQVNYLKEMKEAWMCVLKALTEDAESLTVEKIPTNVLLGDYATLELSSKERGQFLHALDLVFCNDHLNNTSKFRIKKLSNDIKDSVTFL